MKWTCGLPEPVLAHHTGGRVARTADKSRTKFTLGGDTW